MAGLVPACFPLGTGQPSLGGTRQNVSFRWYNLHSYSFLPMLLRVLVLSVVGLWVSAAAVNAQVVPPCSTSSSSSSATLSCSQGSSFSYDLGQEFEQITALIAQFGGIDGIFFKYSFSVTGGSLPAGLTLSPSGLLSGTFASAGQFSFTLTIDYSFGVEGMTVFSESIPIPVAFAVAPYSGPTVTIDPAALSFNLTQNAAGVTQSVTVTNHGNQTLEFSASAATNSGGNWLALSPSAGSITAGGSLGLAVTADPAKLTAGTYAGVVNISVAEGQPISVSALAVVAGTQPNLQLSQTGLRFQAVSGGTATSPQTITVLNPGASSLNFAAAASTLAGGNWLSVSPASGVSSATAAGSVTVTVNPTGLQPGDYYGKIQFSASGAVNSPQVASVVLNVVTPANSPGAFVGPSGLIFIGNAGGTDPSAQTLSITNPSPSALTFLATAFGSSGGTSWLTATPSSGTVSATQPATMSVQPSLQGLAPGVYFGDLALTIASTSTTATAAPQVFHVEILLLVLPAGESPAVKPAPRPQATGCTPTQLLPVFTQLGTGFTAAVGWPTAIEVAVVDDCGNPLVSGSVIVTFSSGDPALTLESLNNGSWTATWNATHSASSVTITAQAQEANPALTGTASIGGTLQPNTATPTVASGGVVGVFNAIANQPLAPGAYGSIYGSNLSAGLNVSDKYPFSLQLGGTSVFLGDEQLPLQFTSAQQVNVVVPYDVPANSTQQLVVQNGSAISIPQPVVVAAAQPVILTSSASGAAYIDVYKPDGTELPANSPVSAGDVIVLYCSGLGAVNPPVAAGSQTPSAPLSHTVNPVTVAIGQTQAQVLFAGLVPSYAQLYQVNVTIPSGLPSGSAVLTLSVGGQQSAPVSITVQ
jgi:uncharacterized protein (TIGR03437 family)